MFHAAQPTDFALAATGALYLVYGQNKLEVRKKDVNYLVVSIAWQGAAIPIAWVCLTKKGGNSCTRERITLLQQVLKLIPANKIDMLLADREFMGVLRTENQTASLFIFSRLYDELSTTYT